MRRSTFSSQRRPGGSPSRHQPRPFRPRDDRRYIAFHKPYEVLSQFSLPDGSGKVTLAAFGFPPDVYPVGRLDYDSEGLLLLSDDAALNKSLLDPAQRHQRSYLAQVEGIPGHEALERLRSGVVIEGRITLPARAEITHPPDVPPRPVPIRFRRDIPTSWIRLGLVEGRNRQVRRMTAAVGHPTLRLLRASIGALDLLKLGLAPGAWRYLSHDELMLALQQ